ncbi:hypothetical protein FQN54_004799 [Arachnomyces sp. PD_36]|nr:hypothetical protein FQN54_004799 [Arachnomyces sp. PD_36]
MDPRTEQEGHVDPPVILETTQDLLYQSLPPLQEHETHKTTSDALHSIKFQGSLGHWASFQDEVQHYCHWKCHRIPHKILSCRLPPSQGESTLQDEMVWCGDETSVSGRFTQNVLHNVTAISREAKVKTSFGDYKICMEVHSTEATFNGTETAGRKIPDYAAVEPLHHSLRFIGEAKTPWKHDLDEFITDYDNKTRPGKLQRAFGQVADYMYFFNLKYGFLTTYDQTIFLKQEKFNGVWALYYSSPILRKSGLKPGLHWDPNVRYKPQDVSVRQCMLWLCAMTAGDEGDYRAFNDTPVREWVFETEPTGSKIVSPLRPKWSFPAGNQPAPQAQAPNPYNPYPPPPQPPTSNAPIARLRLTGSANVLETPPRQTGQADYSIPIRGGKRYSPDHGHHVTPPREHSSSPAKQRPSALEAQQPREPRHPQNPPSQSPERSIELTVAGSHGELFSYIFNGQTHFTNAQELYYPKEGGTYIKIQGKMYRVKIVRRSAHASHRGESQTRQPPKKDDDRSKKSDKNEKRGFFSGAKKR